MCNGANLGYKKSLFKELNGFEGNTNIASGDDIFLLEKAIKKYPKQVLYLKSELAVVKTKPQSSLKDLVSQRIRWAAKTSSYSNFFGKITGLLVLLMNATVICGLLLVLIGLIHYKLLLYILVIKFSIDFLLIYKSARFFNQEELLSSYIFSCLIYPFFSVFVALTSVFSGYKWKGIYYNK
jgi:cellulose synthase/poly-beta-1,6-N-acetylglucosamine synthase-like glycosyltransferase